jgi:hypothetical protein
MLPIIMKVLWQIGINLKVYKLILSVMSWSLVEAYSVHLRHYIWLNKALTPFWLKKSDRSGASGRNGGQLTPGLARWEAEEMIEQLSHADAKIMAVYFN